MNMIEHRPRNLSSELLCLLGQFECRGYVGEGHGGLLGLSSRLACSPEL